MSNCACMLTPLSLQLTPLLCTGHDHCEPWARVSQVLLLLLLLAATHTVLLTAACWRPCPLHSQPQQRKLLTQSFSSQQMRPVCS